MKRWMLIAIFTGSVLALANIFIPKGDYVPTFGLPIPISDIIWLVACGVICTVVVLILPMPKDNKNRQNEK